MKALPSIREMRRASVARDADYDGIFFVAVKTTGIFCRPSCPARTPLAGNVEYFATHREALLAGYRPCKRCRPMDADGRPPAWVRKLMEAVEKSPGGRLRDRDLRAMEIDPSRARRYFNHRYGMTFQAYHRSRRMGLALSKLREGSRMTSVAYEHGYQSNSAFREAFEKTFGRTPGDSDAARPITATIFASPVGPLLLGATDEALCLLEFADRRALESQIKTLRTRFDAAVVPGENAHIKETKKQLKSYFAGELRDFSVPIDNPGTDFQQAVWHQLLNIPYGRTISYEELAKAVGRPGAQRAVGTANGCNRIAIIIPCHRVVNKSGKLGGYGGGLWRKQLLLDLERGQSSSLFDVTPGNCAAMNR